MKVEAKIQVLSVKFYKHTHTLVLLNNLYENLTYWNMDKFLDFWEIQQPLAYKFTELKRNCFSWHMHDVLNTNRLFHGFNAYISDSVNFFFFWMNGWSLFLGWNCLYYQRSKWQAIWEIRQRKCTWAKSKIFVTRNVECWNMLLWWWSWNYFCWKWLEIGHEWVSLWVVFVTLFQGRAVIFIF